MNRKVQHLLTASASVLAIGAGAIVAQANTSGFNIQPSGGADGMLATVYDLTDLVDTTATLPTVVTGVSVTSVTAADATVNLWGTTNAPGDGLSYYGVTASNNTDVTLTNGGSFTVQASAVAAPAAATTGSTTANAAINGYFDGVNDGAIDTYITAGGNIDARFNNTGDLGIVATASSTAVGAGETAAADSLVNVGLTQAGYSTGGDVDLALNNSKNLTVSATSTGNGVEAGTANASVYQAIRQYGETTAPATTTPAYQPSAAVALTNASGATIAISANGSAIGSTAANASASVNTAIWQNASAPNGVASTALTNNGSINITATATGAGAAAAAAAPAEAVTGNSTANAIVTTAFLQGDGEDGGEGELSALALAALPAGADGVSHVFTNNSQVVVGATATTTATGAANATAEVNTAFEQNGTALNVALDWANATGASFTVPVTATATGDVANAYADASGVYQYANATGTFPVDGDGVANISFTNSGTFAVTSKATANGVTDAYAEADADGVYQTVGNAESGLISFKNDGTFTVSADALAVASGVAGTSYASAEANGYTFDSENDAVAVNVTNSGAFTVSANASAQSASATATGIYAHVHGTLDIANSGALSVSATAIDTDTVEANLGDAEADATAIYVSGASDTKDVAITNSGAITATAVTSVGGDPEATGIFVDVSLADPATGAVVINNNAGSITARISTDSGATYQWGTAIDTSESRSPVAINLNGAAGKYGSVYGNINISDDDVITVANGETHFNGTVNSGGDLVGTLDIAKGGTLYLRDNPEGAFADNSKPNYSGPSKVNVDTFDMSDGGVLAIEAPNYRSQNLAGLGDSGNIIYGEYPQVRAVEADVSGGILEIRPSSVTDNGLYSNAYVLNDVIVADTITGTLGAVNTRSVLLTASAHQDDLYGEDQTASDLDTIDVEIKRVAFNAVAGLDRNETSVATAIEGTYGVNLSATNPAYAKVLADLFKIDDATNYANALEQLAATQYAGYLRSSTMAGARFNSLIYDMAECGKGSITNELCRSENGGPRLWITGNYGRVSTDGDNEAAGFKAEQYWIAAGLDFAVSPNFVLGVAGGYLENNNKFKANEYGDKFGDRVKSSGWQAGIYGNYDSGKFYVKGAVSYSDLDGDARRTVDFRPLGSSYLTAPQSLTNGLITSDPDVNVWAAGAEAGVRFPLGANAVITPYASLDYAHAKLKRFDEESADASVQGALLSVRGSDEFFASELGIELAAQWGNISPYIRGGWQHNFGDKRAKFTGEFIGAPAGTSFDVISERFSPDAGVVEVGLAAQFSPNFNAHLGYQGRFSSNLTEHTGGLTLSYLFGGSQPAAPPAPPAPVAPPPPPPPPPQVVCNKGPYIVFFDWDKSDITPEAATVLDSAVTAYGNCDVVPIMLAGYTDRSGSDRYNMGLSARRNTSVQGYLTSRGIPSDRISAQAFGEANNRVPTADGVRELQNRRVEITYGPGSGN